MSFHGYPIEEFEFNNVTYTVEQLHVGWAYSVPSLFKGLRRSNNREHAIEHSIEDIRSNGKEHGWRYDEGNHGRIEYTFSLQQRIKELEDMVNV